MYDVRNVMAVILKAILSSTLKGRVYNNSEPGFFVDKWVARCRRYQKANPIKHK